MAKRILKMAVAIMSLTRMNKILKAKRKPDLSIKMYEFIIEKNDIVKLQTIKATSIPLAEAQVKGEYPDCNIVFMGQVMNSLDHFD